MSIAGHCAECGFPIPPGAPGHRCARCLLEMSLREDGPDEEAEVPLTESTGTEDLLGRRFGPYELLEELGHGGMGVIYRARQVELNRVVALKMIRSAGLLGADFEQRFHTEARAAAALEHPHIVAIHEVGEHEGLNYYTMRLIEGPNLAQELKRQGPLEPKRAAQLVVKLARAVDYAHRRGVLHRDLKPANILLDAAGEPYVTDFGLAKLREQDSGLTLSQAVLGTPNYMAPEQAAGRSREVTTAADVYSLGAILFEVLTGSRPFGDDTPMATMRRVMEEAVPRPTTLNPSLPRDLETICLKCLHKEPERRYASAEALAEDLERWLASEPIRARRVGLWEQGWLWCRRKPALAGMAAATLAVVLLISGLAVWRVAKARELQAYEAYVATIDKADRYIKEGDAERAKTLLFACPEKYRHWEWGRLVRLCHQEALRLRVHEQPLVDSMDTTPPVGTLVFSADSSQLGTVDKDGEAVIWELATGQRLFAFGGSTSRVEVAAFHPKLPQLALGWSNATVTIWDSRQGKQLATLSFKPEAADGGTNAAPSNGVVTRLQFSPDGQLLAATDADRVRVWETGAWQERYTLSGFVGTLRPQAYTPDSVTFSTENRRLVLNRGLTRYSQASGALVYDAATGSLLKTWEPPMSDPWAVCVAPDGEFMTAFDCDDHMGFWLRGKPLGEIRTLVGNHPAVYRRAFFSSDGRRMFIPGNQCAAKVYDLPSGKEILTFPSRINSVEFSLDGERLVTLGGDRLAQVWDLREKRLLLTLREPAGFLQSAVLSPDGRLIATVGTEGVVRVWSATPGREEYNTDTLVWTGSAYGTNPDRLLLGGCLRRSRVHDVPSGRPIAALNSRVHLAMAASFSPDGRRIVTASQEREARVWDAQSGQQVGALDGHTSFAACASYSPDGRVVATGALGEFRLWDARTLKPVYTISGLTGVVWRIVFDPPGERMITISRKAFGPPNQPAAIWDVASGQLRLRIGESNAWPVAVRFMPDGQRLVTVNTDRSVRVHDARTGTTLQRWRLRALPVDMALSPDGRRMAVAVSDRSQYGFDSPMVELWDLERGRPLTGLTDDPQPPIVLCFSPDGQRLLSLSTGTYAVMREAFPWREAEYAHLPGAALPERVEAHARRYWRERLLAEARTDLPAQGADLVPIDQIPFNPADFPPRDPATPTNLLDLTLRYTGRVHSSFEPIDLDYGGNYLAQLPTGQVSFLGIPFDVRGVVMLRYEPNFNEFFKRLWHGYPERVEGIPIQLKIKRLHLLHGATWGAANGTTISSYIWHYADGSQYETPIVYGEDVRDWWKECPAPPWGDGFLYRAGDAQTETSRGKVAWTGTNPVAQAHGNELRLYLSTFENPKPDQVVTHLDYVSKMTSCMAFTVAITVEP